jgi:hypothetical protein
MAPMLAPLSLRWLDLGSALVMACVWVRWSDYPSASASALMWVRTSDYASRALGLPTALLSGTLWGRMMDMGWDRALDTLNITSAQLWANPSAPVSAPL